MSTKTYRGSSLEECFNKVKSDMGGDAIILTSRAFQPILGRFGKTTHEVIATLDEELANQSLPQPQGGKTQKASGGSRGVYGYSRGSAATERVTQSADRRSPGAQSKLRMMDLGPQRAVEVAEARTSEFRDVERRAIEVRGLGEGRRIELRGEEDEAPRRSFSNESRDRMAVRDITPVEPKESRDERIARLEAQVLTLQTSMQIVREAVAARGKAGKAGATPAAALAPTELKPGYGSLRKKLIDAGVVEPLVRRMVDGLADGMSDTDAIEALKAVIAGRILTFGAVEPISGKTRCLAFVGPTGVGKTTTLAKVAARLTLIDRCKVAIISTDTHRVAASKQIETFGDILRVPVKVAYDAGELAQHYGDLAAEGYDFVLVDTPGKSPNDSIAIGEVARMLKELPMLTKYLMVPATLSGPNHDYVTGKFYSLASPDAVILTKCDESADSSHFAHLLTAQAKFNVPIAYVAEGARVPDDLTPAEPHAIAARLLGS